MYPLGLRVTIRCDAKYKVTRDWFELTEINGSVTVVIRCVGRKEGGTKEGVTLFHPQTPDYKFLPPIVL